MFGVSAEEAALSLAAALSPCPHENREYVETVEGQVVALLCVDCGLRLPKSWGGTK